MPGAGEDSCQGDSAVLLSIESGLDRCDDCELGRSNHTKTALCQYISRWLVTGSVDRGWRCLQDCVALVLKSVATSQSDSATVALSIVVIECRLS
jgi:hypothetical protein